MKDELRGKKFVRDSSLVVSLSASANTINNNFINYHLDKILRIARAVVGSAILLTIVTSILIPQVLPVSGNSYINAKLEWIRTPIDGELDFGDIKVGDKIEKGTVLGAIANNRADDYFLNELNREKSSIETALFALENRREQLKGRGIELKLKASKSLINFEETTKIRLSIIRSDLARDIEEKATVSDQIKRYQKANSDYDGEGEYSVVSRVALENLFMKEKQLRSSIIRREQDIVLLASDLESVLDKHYVSDNTPVEQLQFLDTEQQLLNVESEIRNLTIKIERVSTQISARVEFLKRNNYYELVAGVSGIMWDTGFPDGSYVSNGDSVVAIADTKSLSVEGMFHQRYLDDIAAGDPVTIKLMGSSEKLRGIVSDVRIRDQIKSADLTAINPRAPESNEFNVVVDIDERDARDLYIGQRAKVVISKSSSSVIPSLLLFFD